MRALVEKSTGTSTIKLFFFVFALVAMPSAPGFLLAFLQKILLNMLLQKLLEIV